MMHASYPYFETSSLYLFVTVGLCGALLIRSAIKEGKSKKILLACLLYIIFGISRKVDYMLGGMDAYDYEAIFLNSLKEISRFDNLEFLFAWFTRGIRVITSEPVIYRLFCYSLISASYFFFIKNYCPKESSSIPFVLLVFPYLMSFNTMRTSMAISLVLIGLVFLKKQKIILSVIFVLSSVFFHRMSIIYVPFLIFYFLFRNSHFYDSKFKLIFFLCVYSAGGFFVALFLQQYVLSIGLVESTDLHYIVKNADSSIMNAITSLFPLILIACFWLYCNQYLKIDEHRLLKLLIIYDIIIFPFSFVLGMWRANEYMYVARLTFWAVLLHLFYANFSIHIRCFVKIASLVMFLFWLIYRINKTWEPSGYMPYLINWF